MRVIVARFQVAPASLPASCERKSRYVLEIRALQFFDIAIGSRRFRSFCLAHGAVVRCRQGPPRYSEGRQQAGSALLHQIESKKMK
jgi:hypothetical protein